MVGMQFFLVKAAGHVMQHVFPSHVLVSYAAHNQYRQNNL